MLQEIKTDKLYYGFPIFLIGYPDTKYTINITTCSSSYSLGDMLVFGIDSSTNACEQLKHYKTCSINIFSRNYLKTMQYAGSHPGEDKLKHSDIRYRLYENQVPLLEDAFLSIVVTIEKIESFEQYTNFTAKIQKRFVSDSAIRDDHYDIDSLNPVLFAGDEHARIYRFLEE
jgi:flavin reductase (DIM6/NTAB) family NADH-FMN oxidoreductase RutF